jgi:hypothetical protein
LLGARALALPGGAGAAGSGSAWVITADRGVCRFDGLASPAPLTRACPLAPGAVLDADALAVSPDGRQLLVTDAAAASQQVKRFDAATGALLQTYGKAGGYVAPGADVAVAAADRFYFSPSPREFVDPAALGHGSVVAWAPDGASFWVGDHGNRRLVRVAAADGALLDALGWLLCSYASAVDAADPSRVFSNFLEFAADPAAPPADAALVANWGAGASRDFYAWDYGVNACDGWAYAGFQSVATLRDPSGNNRTFGVVGYHPYGARNCSDATLAVVELVRGGSPAAAACPEAPVPATGGLRVVHVVDARAHQPGSLADDLGTLEADGSLRFARTVNDAAAGAYWQALYARRPAFNASGCASWLDGTPTPPAELLGSFNLSANNSQSLMARGSMARPRLPTTASGLTVVFDADSHVNGGFHLGAVRAGSAAAGGGGGGAPGAGWAWRASPYGLWREVDNVTTLQPGNVSVNLRYINASDVDGRFGAAGNFQKGGFAGSVAMAAGAHVFYGFYGEGWYGSEANQMLHFHESGLFVGQWGVPAAPYPEGNTIYASAGVAGNTFSPSLVRGTGADGLEHLYWLNNEEVEHGGVHRWRIDGADSVAFLPVTLA